MINSAIIEIFQYQLKTQQFKHKTESGFAKHYFVHNKVEDTHNFQCKTKSNMLQIFSMWYKEMETICICNESISPGKCNL